MASANHTSDPYANETWKPIVGYEPYYEVSDMGRVRSLDRIVVCKDGKRKPRKGRLLRSAPNSRGHLSVVLCAYGKQRTRAVHVLMMEAFVGPRPAGMDICHWNDQPADNRLANLRYGTRSDNVLDMKRNGNHNHARKTHCKHGHELVEQNRTAHSIRNGTRSCLACSRARSYLKNHPEFKEHFDLIAGQYYEKILRDAPAA